MKLYTEEQVKQIFENLSVSSGYDYNMETYCDSITPIELPSDEEQEKFVHPRSDEYAAGFFRAMEMIEEQIVNQNK